MTRSIRLGARGCAAYLLTCATAVAAPLASGSGDLSPPGPSLAGQPATHLESKARDELAAKQREARERYKRAFELYDEGAYDAALSELKRAYQLAPALRIVFNLGVMSLAVHDHAAAIRYFEQYLAEGATSIPADIRAQVEETLQDLAPRVAKVSVRANVPGAEVLVNDQAVGTIPLADVLILNAGSRRITAHANGWLPASRVVTLAGGDEVALELTLVAPGTLAQHRTEAPRSRVPWFGWSATVLLTGGSIVSGVKALAAQRDFDRIRRELGISARDLESADSRAFRWSVAADALAVGALASLGYSLYFTLYPSEPEPGRESSATRFELTTRGIELTGRF